jgi:hypothetical protein
MSSYQFRFDDRLQQLLKSSRSIADLLHICRGLLNNPARGRILTKNVHAHPRDGRFTDLHESLERRVAQHALTGDLRIGNIRLEPRLDPGSVRFLDRAWRADT